MILEPLTGVLFGLMVGGVILLNSCKKHVAIEDFVRRPTLPILLVALALLLLLLLLLLILLPRYSGFSGFGGLN